MSRPVKRFPAPPGKRKRIRWAALLAAGIASLCWATGQMAQAAQYGSLTTPDSIIDIKPSTFAANNFVMHNFGSSPDLSGQEILNAALSPPGTYNGSWYQEADYSAGLVNGFDFTHTFASPPLVRDWLGFELRHYQPVGGNNHMYVYLEIDPHTFDGGNLTGTNPDPHIFSVRFQPIFGAQDGLGGTPSGGPPANEWNEYGIDTVTQRFLDANASNVTQKGFQSIDDLFLPNGSKSNTGTGSGLVLQPVATIEAFTLAGAGQGISLTDYTDYIQWTFDTDPTAGVIPFTTRFDFGAGPLPLVEPTPIVPEPSSLMLVAFSIWGLFLRPGRKAGRKPEGTAIG